MSHISGLCCIMVMRFPNASLLHGDDVASSMTSITTTAVSKTTEIILDILKVAIERERQRKVQNPHDNTPDLSGDETTYQRLKSGGELAKIEAFSKEDYANLIAKAKDFDIPVAALQEYGKEDTLSVFFLKTDTEAVNSIVQGIVREKLKQSDYGDVKAHEAAKSLTQKLAHEQQRYFLSGSRTLEQMAFYQKNIKFADDNILTDNFSFNRLKFQNESTARLTITDNSTGKFVVLSENEINRESVERNIRQYLGVGDSETISALLNKSERLGFSETPTQKQFKDYLIERDTQNTFTVTGGDVAA